MIGPKTVDERRRYPRFGTSIEALAKTSQGARHPIHINDLSEGGCAVVSERNPLRPGRSYGIKINGLETLGSVATWSKDSDTGLEFDKPLHVAVVDHLVSLNPPGRADD